jgi:hypothetical protein
MKKIYFLVLFLFSFISLQAQDYGDNLSKDDEFKTIFGGRTVGGYGGIGVGYTLIEDRPGVTFDGRGGVILGHSFAVGVAGTGFLNSYTYVQSLNTDVSLTGGYGGIFGELILFPRSQVHVSFPVLAGLGAIASTSWTATQNNATYQNNIEQTMVFMIIEPAIELEFNFTRFFRMSGYFSYRFTTDVEMDNEYASPDALINYSAGLRFKFGKF